MTGMRFARHSVICLAASSAVALLTPGAAAAAVVEIGPTGEGGKPSCPGDPCQVVSRTFGYQAKLGDQRDIFRAPSDGRVVAWSITLGDPGKNQRAFFESRLGGAASAGIAVLRPGPRLTARVLARSPIKRLTPHLGQTVQFPLVRSLRVRKGHIVALRVPTWAPALQLGLERSSSWRASRKSKPRERCLDTARQTARVDVGRLTGFECRYPTARLTYSATMVTSTSRPAG